MNIIYSSKRLYARCWQLSDIDAAKKLWGDPKVLEFIDVRAALTEDDILLKLQQQMALQSQYSVQYWALVLKSTNEIIGCCGLRPYDLEKNIYELGLHLMFDFWGQGFATEAAIACINAAFFEMNMNQLFAGHNPKNITSQKLLTKLGFEYSHHEYYEATGLEHPSYFLSRDRWHRLAKSY